MKRPGVAGAVVHGVLLLLALCAAYFDWTRPKTANRRATDVAIWEGQGADVTAVHLDSTLAKVDLTLKRDKESAKPYPWFRLERTVTVPAPAPPPPAKPADQTDASKTDEAKKDETKPAATPAAPQTKVTVKEFLGSDRTKERVDKLATLTAERDLGKVGNDTLDKLGLAKPRGSLTVTTTKGERKLELGDTAVGDRLRYVRDPSSGHVYAVDTNVFGDLEQADTRLLNADLQPFNAESIENVTVTSGAASRRYAQRDRDKTGKSYWVALAPESGSASTEAVGEKDERATTWFSKLARLKAERYLAEDENPLDTLPATTPPAPAAGAAPAATPAAPPPAESKTVLRLEYEVAGYPPATLELTKVSAGSDKVVYVARTSYTRSRVVVNRFTAEEIEKDLSDLLGA